MGTGRGSVMGKGSIMGRGGVIGKGWGRCGMQATDRGKVKRYR